MIRWPLMLIQSNSMLTPSQSLLHYSRVLLREHGSKSQWLHEHAKGDADEGKCADDPDGDEESNQTIFNDTRAGFL